MTLLTRINPTQNIMTTPVVYRAMRIRLLAPCGILTGRSIHTLQDIKLTFRRLQVQTRRLFVIGIEHLPEESASPGIPESHVVLAINSPGGKVDSSSKLSSSMTRNERRYSPQITERSEKIN